MKRINRKLALVAGLTAVVAGLGTGVAFAAGDTDDNISPAGTSFTASSTNFVLKGTINGVPVTVTCKNVSISGTTPSTGLGPWNITNLSFTGCTASITTNNTNGHWQVTFIDAANDESQSEPNTGDQLLITIPKAGARITFSTFPGCTVTVAPSGPANITGGYDDVNTLSFNGVSIPVSGSGCAVSSFTLTATFKFTPNIQDVS